jgi:hypothetical protein
MSVPYLIEGKASRNWRTPAFLRPKVYGIGLLARIGYFLSPQSALSVRHHTDARIAQASLCRFRRRWTYPSGEATWMNIVTTYLDFLPTEPKLKAR